MIIKLAKYLLVLAIFSLLSACAQLGQQGTQDIYGKNAMTYESSGKAEENKKALEHYENYSNRYGRRGQDFASHTRANIRYYEQAENSLVFTRK